MSERRTWRLYVCPQCGGYGHNNMTIHLGDDDCDPRKVEDFYVERESPAQTVEDYREALERLTKRVEKAWPILRDPKRNRGDAAHQGRKLRIAAEEARAALHPDREAER